MCAFERSEKEMGFIMNYGEFGGQYVPQELKEKLLEIESEFQKISKDNEFRKEYYIIWEIT